MPGDILGHIRLDQSDVSLYGTRHQIFIPESELKGPEVVVRVVLDIGATKSHKSGSIAIAIETTARGKTRSVERAQEMPRKRYPRDANGGG